MNETCLESQRVTHRGAKWISQNASSRAAFLEKDRPRTPMQSRISPPEEQTLNLNVLISLHTLHTHENGWSTSFLVLWNRGWSMSQLNITHRGYNFQQIFEESPTAIFLFYANGFHIECGGGSCLHCPRFAPGSTSPVWTTATDAVLTSLSQLGVGTCWNAWVLRFSLIFQKMLHLWNQCSYSYGEYSGK